jgi:hypothetical protein
VLAGGTILGGAAQRALLPGLPGGDVATCGTIPCRTLGQRWFIDATIRPCSRWATCSPSRSPIRPIGATGARRAGQSSRRCSPSSRRAS